MTLSPSPGTPGEGQSETQNAPITLPRSTRGGEENPQPAPLPGQLSILSAHAEGKHPRIDISAEHWRPIAEFLRHDPQLEFDWLRCLSGIDYAADQKMACVYDLWSFRHRHTIAVKVFCPRENPHIPTVSDLWPAANWQEREAFDLFGIVFDNHPDPRRILLADDWVGHPLRKDYVFPREYHGIPGSVELDWKQQPNYPKKI